MAEDKHAQTLQLLMRKQFLWLRPKNTVLWISITACKIQQMNYMYIRWLRPGAVAPCFTNSLNTLMSFLLLTWVLTVQPAICSIVTWKPNRPQTQCTHGMARNLSACEYLIWQSNCDAYIYIQIRSLCSDLLWMNLIVCYVMFINGH